MAAFIGQPEAARAVGNALNKNVDRNVPCHRVVRADGDVGGYGGGYGGGKQKKTKLLLREGVLIRNGKVLTLT